MKEVAPFVGKFSKRMFVLLDYSVDDESFVIKIFYSKGNFEHLIQEFVCEMIDELKKVNYISIVGLLIAFCVKR